MDRILKFYFKGGWRGWGLSFAFFFFSSFLQADFSYTYWKALEPISVIKTHRSIEAIFAYSKRYVVALEEGINGGLLLLDIDDQKTFLIDGKPMANGAMVLHRPTRTLFLGKLYQGGLSYKMEGILLSAYNGKKNPFIKKKIETKFGEISTLCCNKKWLIGGMKGGEIQIWQIDKNGNPLLYTILKQKEGGIKEIFFDQKEQIISLTKKGVVHLWQINSGNLMAVFKNTLVDRLLLISASIFIFVPKKKHHFIGVLDWSGYHKATFLSPLAIDYPIEDVVITQDRSTIFFSCKGSFKLYRLSTSFVHFLGKKKKKMVPLKYSVGEIKSLFLTENMLFTVLDKIIVGWQPNFSYLEKRKRLLVPGNFPLRKLIKGESNRLIGISDQEIFVWLLPSFLDPMIFSYKEKAPISCGVLSFSKNTLILGNQKGLIWEIDLNNGEIIKTFSFQDKVISNLLFLEKKLLLSASLDDDFPIVLWDYSQEREQKIHHPIDFIPYAIAYGVYENKPLCFFSSNASIEAWTWYRSIFKKIKWKKSMEFQAKNATVLDFFYDKSWLISANRGGILTLWGMKKKNALIARKSLDLPIVSLAIHQQCGILLTGHSGGGIYLWDLYQFKKGPIIYKDTAESTINDLIWYDNQRLISINNRSVLTLREISSPEEKKEIKSSQRIFKKDLVSKIATYSAEHSIESLFFWERNFYYQTFDGKIFLQPMKKSEKKKEINAPYLREGKILAGGGRFPFIFSLYGAKKVVIYALNAYGEKWHPQITKKLEEKVASIFLESLKKDLFFLTIGSASGSIEQWQWRFPQKKIEVVGKWSFPGQALIRSLVSKKERIYMGDDRGYIGVIEKKGKKSAQTSFKAHTSWVTALFIDEKQNRLISGSHDGSIILWDLKFYEPLRIWEKAHQDSVIGIFLMESTEENDLLSVGKEGDIKEWNPKKEYNLGKFLLKMPIDRVKKIDKNHLCIVQKNKFILFRKKNK